jgi:hypothetical protein
MRLGVDQCGQEDVSEPVEADGVQVIVGEIELEPTAEVLDVVFELRPAQSGDGCHGLFETSTRVHGPDPQRIGRLSLQFLPA